MTVLQNMNINYTGHKFDITEKNQLFSESKVYVMYHGENRNNSFISKENVDRAMNSIYNIPIVGEFIESEEGKESNNFGGHGGEVIVENDDIKFIHTTKPIGVVPESASVYWEVVKDKNGEDKEYLVVDGALLWNRYEDAVETLKSADFGQSMEIEVSSGVFDDKSGLYNIEEFSFSAFCVLGLDDREGGKVEPAFEDSKIMTYSEEFSKELKEMKSELGKYFNSSSKEENDKEVNKLSKNKKETVEKYDLETAEEAVIKAEETKLEADIEIARELVSELEDSEEKDALIERLDAIEVVEEDEENDEEFDNKEEDGKEDEESEVIQTETSGIAGNVITDEKEAKESQGTAGETGDSDLGGDPEVIADEHTETDYSVKYEELKSEFNDIQKELKSLRKFKENVEKEEHEKNSIELFDKLGLGEEDVKDIDIYSLSMDELEDKCYAILGRKMAEENTDQFSFKEENKKSKNRVNLSKASVDAKTNKYGNLFNKFGKK